MANIRDIRRRIRSIRNIRKVTKAMELVSGAKLRRAQTRIEALRPFANDMEELIREAAGRSHLPRQPLLERREVKATALLLMSGDRGLAGSFNSSVLRRCLELGREERALGRDVVWLAVGKRGAGSLRFRGLEPRKVWTGFTDRPVYADAEQIAHALIELYSSREVDRVVMVYNEFISPIQQIVHVGEILPVPLGDLQAKSERELAMEGTIIYEPDEPELMATLLPTALEVAVYRALLESTASEHGARMSAMRNASDNASDLIDRLTLDMNRARQAAITQEILEVVAGADALG